jgi:PadR family transcriptional regulator, regulatory protein PadR
MRRKPGGLVPLETAILGVALAFQKDGVDEFHGYQIAKHLADATNQRLLTAYGTLYRALGRLENMGLLTSHWENPQIAADENRPGRRLYSLTAEGVVVARASHETVRAPKRARRRIAPA